MKKLKLKLTPQRQAVLEFLRGNTSHPSALDVFNALSSRFPGMSFATVYNILDALREKGVIRELSVDSERKRFDPNTGTHHHLVCTRCKTVKDVHRHFRPSLPSEERHDFELTGLEVTFFGICPECRREEHIAARHAHTNKIEEVDMVYTCSVCGYQYDEKLEKAPFDKLDDEWHCPVCNAPKSAFQKSS